MTQDSGFQLQLGGAELYQRETAVFMQPLVDGLLDAADLRAGQAVLDLACGPGIAAVSAAARVGPTGRVVGVDVNPGMIEVARRTPATEPTIEWLLASALDLPFDDDTFDALVVQQGIQFFPDLDVALGEMRRVVRPGGLVVATSWTPLDTNPYLHAQYVALAEAVGEEEVASLSAAFALSGERLEDAWVAAGMSAVSRLVHAPPVDLPPLDTYVPRQLGATPWSNAFQSLDEAGQRAVVERVKERLADHTTRDVATVPFSTWIVAGRA